MRKRTSAAWEKALEVNFSESWGFYRFVVVHVQEAAFLVVNMVGCTRISLYDTADIFHTVGRPCKRTVLSLQRAIWLGHEYMP